MSIPCRSLLMSLLEWFSMLLLLTVLHLTNHLHFRPILRKSLREKLKKGFHMSHHQEELRYLLGTSHMNAWFIIFLKLIFCSSKLEGQIIREVLQANRQAGYANLLNVKSTYLFTDYLLFSWLMIRKRKMLGALTEAKLTLLSKNFVLLTKQWKVNSRLHLSALIYRSLDLKLLLFSRCKHRIKANSERHQWSRNWPRYL